MEAKWSQSPVLPWAERAYEIRLNAGSTAVVMSVSDNRTGPRSTPRSSQPSWKSRRNGPWTRTNLGDAEMPTSSRHWSFPPVTRLRISPSFPVCRPTGFSAASSPRRLELPVSTQLANRRSDSSSLCCHASKDGARANNSALPSKSSREKGAMALPRKAASAKSPQNFCQVPRQISGTASAAASEN